MLCRTQFIRRKRLWCLVSAGAAIWVSDVFLVRIMYLRCLQRFSGASESSQHPSWDAEGGQYRICLHLGGPRTENQTSLTSTTALLTMERCSACERTECASRTQGKAAVLPKPTTRFPTHHTPSVLLGLSFPYLGLCFQFLFFKGTLLHEQRRGKR